MSDTQLDTSRDRKYQTTHPWITFRVDLSRSPATLWMLLGEARSKIEHIEGSPLGPEVAEELQKIFLAKGVRATTAIEGNTLSEEQVRKRLEGTLELPPSQEYLGQEIDNIVYAVNRLARDLLDTGPVPLTVATIKEFNRLVLKGLPLPEEVAPGEIRRHSVGVGKYLAAPAEDCEYLLVRLVEWLNSSDFVPPDVHPDMRLVYVIIKAVVAHLYLAWIHPFGDGNGRTSRLVEFQILVSSGVPFPAAHLLGNHYNQTRSDYYRQLEMSSRSGGDLIAFLCYAAQGFIDGLREQIRLIRAQQMEMAWQGLVHDVFAQSKSAMGQRRRMLLLELGSAGRAVPKARIRSLSPTLAEAYAVKTDKTLTRDLNALEKTRLVVRDPGGWRARVEIVLAFLPKKVRPLLVEVEGDSNPAPG